MDRKPTKKRIVNLRKKAILVDLDQRNEDLGADCINSLLK